MALLRSMRIGPWMWISLSILALLTWEASAQTNGIFADFTTDRGSFTCLLDYTNSPKAVANFVGLATGERAWLDFKTGTVRTNAFYNGSIFHRVISGFVDQAGARNDPDDDGPGYAFVDQFNSALTFDKPWVLAMANSGKNSNGSQFFVTVAPFVSGNNSYVIFGRVISGTNVVAAINRVATDTNDKPLTNVVIQRVVIRRVGPAAQAFDINSRGLPIVTNVPIQIVQNDGRIFLTYSNRLYADNRWFSSTNLGSWTNQSLGIEVAPPLSNSVEVLTDSVQKFFRIAQVRYASTTFAPKNVLGRKLTMVFSGGIGTNTIVFNSTNGGTYSFPGVSSGTVKSYSWTQDPYRGSLWPIKYSILNDMTLLFDFTSNTNGVFSGTVYNVPPFGVSGTFTLLGP